MQRMRRIESGSDATLKAGQPSLSSGKTVCEFFAGIGLVRQALEHTGWVFFLFVSRLLVRRHRAAQVARSNHTRKMGRSPPVYCSMFSWEALAKQPGLGGFCFAQFRAQKQR
jgi:hypothetical protein